MAFNKRSLVLAHSVPYATDTAPMKVFEYATTDAVATVIAAGYFNTARDDGKINVNDVINCQCVMGGTGDFVRVIVTAVPTSGNVTVSVNTGASGA